jgi:moderate conductance mechanosensitive channel
MIPAPVFLIPETWGEWREWLTTHGITILVILAGLLLIRYMFHRVFGSLLHRAAATAARSRSEDPAIVKRRADTLVATLDWALAFFLLFVGTALILDQLGVQVSALIAGVGVVGIAVGLGAQTLIKDVINGIFILVEGQYAVGDVVKVGGVSGQVIDINPRRTVLRDLDGNVHTVPNSAITVATNMTQVFSRINMNIAVAYEEDVDRVIDVVNEVCAQLATDRAADIIEAPKVLRVDLLGENGVEVKVVGDVKAFTQWELTGELRRRIKRRFDQEGIEIPYPHRTFVQGKGFSPPPATPRANGSQGEQPAQPQTEKAAD